MCKKNKVKKYLIIIIAVISVLAISLVVYFNRPVEKLNNNSNTSTEVEKNNQGETKDNNDVSNETKNKTENSNIENNNKTNNNVSEYDTNSSKDKNENVSANKKEETNNTTKQESENSNNIQNNNSQNEEKTNTNNNVEPEINNNINVEDKSEVNNEENPKQEETTPVVDEEYERLKKIYRYETSSICYEESINVAFQFADNSNFKHTACQSGAYKGELVGYAIVIYYKDNTTEIYMGN